MGSQRNFWESYRDNHLIGRSSAVLLWFPGCFYSTLLHGDLRISQVGYMMSWDWILTRENIWFSSKKGDGTSETNRLPKWHSILLKEVNPLTGIGKLFGYCKRLKITGDWNWSTTRIVIRDLSHLETGSRTECQSPWDDHYTLRYHWHIKYEWTRMKIRKILGTRNLSEVDFSGPNWCWQ